jgi:hypothetical protein
MSLEEDVFKFWEAKTNLFLSELNLTNFVAPEPEGSSLYLWSLSWANWIHSTPPQPISLRFILIPSSYLHLVLPSGLFPLGFPTKTLYTYLSSPMCTTSPTPLILVDLICLVIFGDEYKIWCFSLCNFLILHPSVQIFSLDPVLWHPLSLCFSPLCEKPSFTPI